jgi:hypothetical protein
MQDDELVNYVMNALQRAKAGELSGSHLAGVFGKAASGFEKEIQLLTELIGSCGLNYEKDVRPAVNDKEPSKLTLGECCRGLRVTAQLRPSCASSFVPGGGCERRWSSRPLAGRVRN